jgi:hypothetical protein
VPAASIIPEHPTLEILRESAAGCKACDLWKTGTQTVFGEGAPDDETRRREMARFVDDLKRVAAVV